MSPASSAGATALNLISQTVRENKETVTTKQGKETRPCSPCACPQHPVSVNGPKLMCSPAAPSSDESWCVPAHLKPESQPSSSPSGNPSGHNPTILPAPNPRTLLQSCLLTALSSRTTSACPFCLSPVFPWLDQDYGFCGKNYHKDKVPFSSYHIRGTSYTWSLWWCYLDHLIKVAFTRSLHCKATFFFLFHILF